MKRGEIRIIPLENYIFYEFPYKRIEGGRELYFEIIYDFVHNIALGSGILYSRGSRNLAEWYRGLFNNSEFPRPEPEIYEVSVCAPYLIAQYGSKFGKLKCLIGSALYYGFGTLSADVRSYNIPFDYRNFIYKSRGIGYSVSFGFSIELDEGVAIENSFGYRSLVTKNLKDSYGNELGNFKLDFKGFFIRGGISVAPWG